MSDVVVIGGGIAGCTTACYLARDGVPVTLVDRFDLGTLASGSNAGSLHAQIQHETYVEHGAAWARAFCPALPFYAYSIDRWVEAQTALGDDLEVSLDGGLLAATSDDEMRQIEAKVAIERAAGLPIEILDRRTLQDLAPYLSPRVTGGALCPLEGKANPLAAVGRFAAEAESLGARIHRNTRVDAIERRSGSASAGYRLETNHGDFDASRIVIAAGADTARVAGLLGVELDIQSFPIQLSVTEKAPPLIGHLVYSAGAMLTLKQSKAGTVLIGGGWPAERGPGGQVRVSPTSLLGNLRAAVNLVPDIEPLTVVRTWAAEVNGNRSWLPILGPVPGLPGVFLNYVPWMGFSGGPAGGRIVASQVQGREPDCNFPLAPFAPA